MTQVNVLALLLLKHFVCDFPLQAFPYQYRNKGTYGHLGGILHSGIHVVGSLLVLVWFTDMSTAIALSLLDGLCHYHIDYAKMNIGRIFNLKPDNSEMFWVLLGIDQLLHMATYYVMVYLAFN